MTNVSPGWYQDPANSLNERFWNGTSWTEQVRTSAPQTNVNTGQDWSGITPVNNYSVSNFPPNNAPQGNTAPFNAQQNFTTPFGIPNQSPQSDLAPRPVNMIDALTRAFTKYADFKGRASKSEFWFFYLWSFVFVWIPFINIIWLFASFIPLLAVGTRRLHDIGKPGVYWLFSLIPFAGFIIMIVFWVTDGERDGNIYGPAR